jgi:transcriptional regulator with XRE-family HTH domain
MLGADLVREARRRAGLTQRELAERTGTTQSSIARLETGRTSPSFDLVLRLVRHCGFDLFVQVVPYDDSDVAQSEALLRRDTDDRVATLESGLAFAAELREAYERAVGV